MSEMERELYIEALQYLRHSYKFWRKAINCTESERELARIKCKLLKRMLQEHYEMNQQHIDEEDEDFSEEITDGRCNRCGRNKRFNTIKCPYCELLG